MSPGSDLQGRLQTAVLRALVLEGKTRFSRSLFEASFSTREVDPRRKPKNAQKPYHLVESESSFLRTGEPQGSYSDRPDKLHSRIDDKVNRLPDRLALLFEDVSLLDNPPFSEREVMADTVAGEELSYFTPERWGDAWLDLMDIPPQRDLTEAFTPGSSPSHTPAGEFGRKLGKLWSSLMLYPSDIPPQRLWLDAIQGFIDGLYLENPELAGEDRPEQRREFIERLVDEIEARALKKIDTRAQAEEEWFNDWKARNKSFRQSREKVTKILENEGIAPVYVSNYVYSELTDSSHEHFTETDTEVDDEINPEAVREFIEAEQLRAKAAILERLYDDAALLREKSGRGPEPTAILKAVYRREGTSSVEIAQACTREEHQAGVTETAQDMAGHKNPDDRPGKVWAEFPLLEGTPEGWTLTTYGRLLARHMFDGHLGINASDITDDHVKLLAPRLEY